MLRVSPPRFQPPTPVLLFLVLASVDSGFRRVVGDAPLEGDASPLALKGRGGGSDGNGFGFPAMKSTLVCLHSAVSMCRFSGRE